MRPVEPFASSLTGSVPVCGGGCGQPGQLGCRTQGLGSGGQAGRLGWSPAVPPLPSDPGAPLWGVFRGSEPMALGIRGVWGNLGGTGGAALVTGWPLGVCFSTSGTPGALGWRHTWMPECWPGRVLLCPPSLCQAAGASGQGRRGQEGRVSSGCSLNSGTHGRWQCVRRSVCLSAGLFTVLVGVPLPHIARLPGRGSWARQWAAEMRSQGSAGCGPRQGPAWVGRGSRKVLRVWVSAWGPGGWVKPCSRGAGQVQHRAQAAGAPGGGLKDTPHAPTPRLQHHVLARHVDLSPVASAPASSPPTTPSLPCLARDVQASVHGDPG